MKFIHDDGGRAAAGFTGRAGDCVARAVAIASGRPYREVYDRLAEGNLTERRTKRTGRSSGKRSAREGIRTTRKWFKDYMTHLGFRWVPTMRIGSGCQVHLADGELPMGRLVVSVSKHYTAVIDGVIRDTYDPSDRPVTIYPADSLWNIPAGATRLANGAYAYAPKRCVYGYWVFAGLCGSTTDRGSS